MTASRARRASAIVGFWLLVGLVSAGQTYLQVTAAGMHHSFWRIAGWEAIAWTAWAIFTPIALGLRTRFPLELSPWRSIPLHLAAGTAVALAHGAISAAAAELIDPFGARMMPMRHRFSLASLGSLSSDLLVYAAILGTAYGFDSFRRLRERELRESQLERQLAESRLTALNLQLQPHFLFNTLHSIAGLVRSERNPEAVRMITGLSEMLRSTLEQRAQEISLDEELRMLRRYLDIQQARFGSRLTVTLAIDDDTRGARVPTLLLQPLAENALRHGIEKSAGSGTLEVVAKRVGDRLRLEIRDSGPGFSGTRPPEGVGLRVTRERLEALYGGEHRLGLDNDPGGGAVASVEIPWNDAD